MGDDEPRDHASPPLPDNAPHYPNDPLPQTGWPTWVWVLIAIFLVTIGLPLLAFGALYLFCYFVPWQNPVVGLPKTEEALVAISLFAFAHT